MPQIYIDVLFPYMLQNIGQKLFFLIFCVLIFFFKYVYVQTFYIIFIFKCIYNILCL